MAASADTVLANFLAGASVPSDPGAAFTMQKTVGGVTTVVTDADAGTGRMHYDNTHCK